MEEEQEEQQRGEGETGVFNSSRRSLEQFFSQDRVVAIRTKT